MGPNEKIHDELEERNENSSDTIKCEMQINEEKITFTGNGVERVKDEKGIIKVDTSKNGSRVSIWGEMTLPFELATTSDKLGLINGEFSFGMEDSIERGRVVRYQIDLDDDEEIKEISVNKNGEYQIGQGKMESEDNGRKLTLSIENIKLVIEGFGRERKLIYSEETLDNKHFIVEIRSQKEINASKRIEVLNTFRKLADEINGDRHGLARGVAQILNENDAIMVIPSKT